MDKTTVKTSPFEHHSCGRCGGTGYTGFTWVQGGLCFGCSGSGIRYTKRGYAARLMYDESLTVPFEAVKLGDKVYMAGVPGFSAGAWFTVDKIGFGGSAIINADGSRTELVTISGQDKNGHNYGISGGARVRVAWTAEEKQAKLAAALAYMATLTKSGTVRKVSATAARAAARAEHAATCERCREAMSRARMCPKGRAL